VGINTSMPEEALSVNGNVLITGDLYKPSDRRIKSDFVKVDSGDQLEALRKLTIYDYFLNYQQTYERGIIAQELAGIIPSAVHRAGDVMLAGNKVPNLMVVNERVLLYENLGATKQLDINLNDERLFTANISTRVDMLEEKTKAENSDIKSKLNKILNMLVSEETEQPPEEDGAFDSANSAFNVERLNNDPVPPLPPAPYSVSDGLRIFGVGPARSMWILGFFLPPIWALGMLFIFSETNSRRVGGILNVVMYFFYLFCFYSLQDGQTHIVTIVLYIFGFSFVCFAGVVYRLKMRRRREQMRLNMKLH